MKKYCRYCRNYTRSEKTNGIDDRGRKSIHRLCIVTEEDITSDTIACDEFEKVKTFYCDRDHNRYDIIVCISRQDKKKKGCLKCKQGKIIRGMK